MTEWVQVPLEKETAKCNVCGVETTLDLVCSSGLGAISFLFCKDCLQSGAEPLFMWHNTIWCCGGPEHVHEDYQNFAVSFKDGEYIKWPEIVACYDPDAFEEIDA